MPRLTVGLTGGIGSGKSAALAAFRRAGAETISLDEIARALSRPGGPVFRAVVKTLGKGVLGPGGELDRRAAARRVFARAGLRRRLESASHPAILRAMRARLRSARRPVVVVDVPLLFEAGLAGNFDLTMAVTAGRELRLRRAAKRDKTSRAEVLRRMRAQLPARRREALADLCLPNEDGLRALELRVREYHRAFELIANR